MIILLSILASAVLLVLSIKINKKGKKVANIFSNVLLLFSGVFISFASIESILWMAEKYAPQSLPPSPPYFTKYKASPFVLVKNSILYMAPSNGFYSTFGLSYKTNGMGFREKEFNPKKNKNVFRILVFGDSVTFGVAVADEHRYTFILENMLNRHLATLKSRVFSKVEVLNFGVPGYATDQERDLIKGILSVVECDLALIGFFHNDIKITTQSTLGAYSMKDLNTGDYLFMNIPALSNPSRNLKTLSKLSSPQLLIEQNWYEELQIYKFLKDRTNLFLTNKMPNPKIWKYVRNEFIEIKNLAQRHKLPSPIVALLPQGFVEPRKNNFKSPTGGLARINRILKLVEEDLKKIGIQTVNPMPLFKEHSNMSMAVSEWENHPNYLAHYLYARAIYEQMLKNDFFG